MKKTSTNKIPCLPKDLLRFAEVLLGNDFSAFEQGWRDLFEIDFASLIEKYSDWIREVNIDLFDNNKCSDEKWCFQDCRDAGWWDKSYLDWFREYPIRFFVDFAQWKGRLCWEDWAGEGRADAPF